MPYFVRSSFISNSATPASFAICLSDKPSTLYSLKSSFVSPLIPIFEMLFSAKAIFCISFKNQGVIAVILLICSTLAPIFKACIIINILSSFLIATFSSTSSKVKSLYLSRVVPFILSSNERIAFKNEPVKLLLIDITSPVAFILVPSILFA